MSMSFSYVAVTADAKSVEDALFKLCPEFYIMEQQPELGTFVQMYGYCQSRSGYLNGLHPSDVKAFCQHQGWCIIIDFSLQLPEADHVLSALSSQFGTVVTAMTQGTSGSASFSLFQNGQMKRKIANNSGTITKEGEPLAAEAGIEGDVFYITQLDILWQAQGLPPYLARLGGPYSAVHYLDNTEASVEKDIEEIAERTRQYEELEALKARQRKTGELAFPDPVGQPAVPQLGVIQRLGAEEQPNAPQLGLIQRLDAVEQPAAAAQPDAVEQSNTSQPPAPTPTENPRISSLLATSEDIDALPQMQHDTPTDNQVVSVGEPAPLNKEPAANNAPATSNDSPTSNDSSTSNDSPTINDSDGEDSLDDREDSLDDDDSDDDEKAEKPKDKPWWKLW